MIRLATTPALMLAMLSLLTTAALSACSDEPEPPAAAETEGGEDTTVLQDAKARADEVHGQVKEEIKPAAEFVDEKTRAVVDEGKKLVGAEGESEPSDDGEAGDGEPE
jgi:hypothetical protein